MTSTLIRQFMSQKQKKFYNPRESSILEFHEKFGVAVQEEPSLELVDLRFKLIKEEALELLNALDKIKSGFIYYGGHIPKELWIETLDGMADLQVVLSGTAIAIKQLRNFDEAFFRVHASNMSKLGEDGKPILREDGKVLKG